MATKLDELWEWLNEFPEGSEIVSVDTSIYGDDARITVKTPDGKFDSKEVLNRLCR